MYNVQLAHKKQNQCYNMQKTQHLKRISGSPQLVKSSESSDLEIITSNSFIAHCQKHFAIEFYSLSCCLYVAHLVSPHHHLFKAIRGWLAALASVSTAVVHPDWGQRTAKWQPTGSQTTWRRQFAKWTDCSFWIMCCWVVLSAASNPSEAASHSRHAPSATLCLTSLS